MAIIVPQQEDISLRNRGSRIQPVDSYVRPAAPPAADNSIGEALNQFGAVLTGFGGEQQRKEEAEQLRNIEYYKSIAGDIADGTPVQAQLDQRLAMVSPTVRARVAESIGFDIGERWWATQEERLKTNPEFLTNPAAVEAEKKRIMQEAGKQFFAGDRATGSGFLKAINGRINSWEGTLSGRRESLYLQKQEEGMTRDIIDRAEKAARENYSAYGSLDSPREAAASGRTASPGNTAAGVTRLALAASGGGRGSIENTVNKIIGVESAGNPNAKNPRSSATGLGQYISSTWIASIRKYRPDLMVNRSVEDVLALRRNPEIAREILTKDVQGYAQFLQQRGYAATEGNMYLVHFAGAGGADKVLRASEGASVASVLGQAVVEANPFLRNWSVGELRNWAHRKMGEKVNPAAAARDAVRATDREYGASSSLDNIYRRNVVARALQTRAMETGEARFLDYMPKELMTPEVESQFIETRRKVEELAWSRRQRERQEEAQREQDQLEEMQKQAIEKIGRGEKIDPYKDSIGPDGRPNAKAFDWLLQRQNINLRLEPNQSLSNRMDFETKVTEAETTGDWTKIDPAFVDGRPSEAQLRRHILERKDLRDEDIKVLLGEVPKIMATIASINHPVVNQTYSQNLLPTLQQMQTQIVAGGGVMAAMAGINYPSLGQPFFQHKVQMGIRAWLSENPGNTRVPEHVLLSIANDAASQTVEYVTRMRDLATNKMGTGGGASVERGTAETWARQGSDARAGRSGPEQNRPAQSEGAAAPPAPPVNLPPNAKPTRIPGVYAVPGENGETTMLDLRNTPGQQQGTSITNPQPAAAPAAAPTQSSRPDPVRDLVGRGVQFLRDTLSQEEARGYKKDDDKK